jgi:MoaA/NifB/PqqE/SkfB family radical SAM enzyme
MNLPTDKFCVLPWVSLETSPIGTVRPCCLAENELRDDTGTKFNLATAEFAAIQRSQDMQNLRQQFLSGEQPETCRKCWREERSGRTSKRMHTLDRLKHMLPDQAWTIDAKPLMFLDLKLGNICNLKCRICGSWSSSTFATEELANLGPDQNRKDSFHYKMLRQGAWPRENPVFWSELAGIADQIRYLEFTGGEPFMIEEHFDLLRSLASAGLAPNIEIHYNTNGTQWPRDAVAVWKSFKTVEIAFSIDDVGARFEYQRTNAVWTEVVENIARFRELRRHAPNIQLQVCSTVNVFNVAYLEELSHWIEQQNFDYVYWNMMHEAYYFSISTLPEEAKRVISQRLTLAQVNARDRLEFDRIVDFMNGAPSLDGQILRMKIADLDRRRGQDLRQVEPELANLIGYTGPGRYR